MISRFMEAQGQVVMQNTLAGIPELPGENQSLFELFCSFLEQTLTVFFDSLVVYLADLKIEAPGTFLLGKFYGSFLGSPCLSAQKQEGHQRQQAG